MTVEGLTLTGDHLFVSGTGSARSRIFGDGDKAMADLVDAIQTGQPIESLPDWQKKFAYSPFRFFINQSVLTSLDQDMRTDFKERYRVKIQLKLYKDDAQRASGTPEITLNAFDFAVKFNSNTRLFDVLRGGVWYYDPVVSSTDPDNTITNPFTAQWLQHLTDKDGQPVDLSGIFQTRFSLTPGVIVPKGI
jgi:hypothetical protein